MLVTGGGSGLWWLDDAFFVNHTVRGFNEGQGERERATLSLLGELDRWSHRLRLYCRFNDPVGPSL